MVAAALFSIHVFYVVALKPCRIGVIAILQGAFISPGTCATVNVMTETYTILLGVFVIVGGGVLAVWLLVKRERQGKEDGMSDEMESSLNKIDELVRNLEKESHEKFGAVSQHLKDTNQTIRQLQQTTNSLSEVLASPKKRGDWGERMAEDVLRVAGFKEGIQYKKQQTMAEGGRPDYTFFLPDDLLLHMDAKFPLDNYTKYVQAESEQEAEQHRKAFLNDVKKKVKELTQREYIDTAGGTVDTALLFVPNEQIYAFIWEQDSSIIDDALRNNIIICSPVTLFAVLAVIRQARDNFHLERTSGEILELLAEFRKQWYNYFVEKLENLGKSLQAVQNHYDDLASTRRNQLEKQLERIHELQEGIEEEQERK